MNADGSLAETLTYPAQMDAVGDVQKVKDTIYPSYDAAMNCAAAPLFDSQVPVHGRVSDCPGAG